MGGSGRGTYGARNTLWTPFCQAQGLLRGNPHPPLLHQYTSMQINFTLSQTSQKKMLRLLAARGSNSLEFPDGAATSLTSLLLGHGLNASGTFVAQCELKPHLNLREQSVCCPPAWFMGPFCSKATQASSFGGLRSDLCFWSMNSAQQGDARAPIHLPFTCAVCCTSIPASSHKIVLYRQAASVLMKTSM